MAYPVSVNYAEGGINADEKWEESREVLWTYHFDEQGHPVSCEKENQGEKIEDTYDNSNPALEMTEDNYMNYINGVFDDVM